MTVLDLNFVRSRKQMKGNVEGVLNNFKRKTDWKSICLNNFSFNLIELY